MRKLLVLGLLAACMTWAAASDSDFKTAVVKHLTTSRDFTVKVAEAMPAANYDFKLTAPQMSFAQQLVHLSQGLTYFLAAFEGKKADPAKPKSMSKDDVIPFIKSSFDSAIQEVSGLNQDQLSKVYKSDEGTESGMDLLLGALDHTTHHRASAEMYLRAKGITPPEYQF